jgi:hypothetical protein
MQLDCGVPSSFLTDQPSEEKGKKKSKERTFQPTKQAN